MAPSASDWYMFCLGVCGAVATLWLYHTRRTAMRTGRGLGHRSLGKFSVFAGCVMGLEGVVQLGQTVRWQVMLLGFFIGGLCGGVAGKVWISKHPNRQENPRTPGLSGWLRSWRVLVVPLLITVACVALPQLSFVTATISHHAEIDAAGAQGLAGLFLVFGLLLITAPHVPGT